MRYLNTKPHEQIWLDLNVKIVISKSSIHCVLFALAANYSKNKIIIRIRTNEILTSERIEKTKR